MRILQFWSGGADSTYLLLQNLRCGYDVDCVYIMIADNPVKTQRELKAQELLKKDIDKFCQHFGAPHPTYLENSRIDIYFPGHIQACQQITFAAFASMLGQCEYDEVHLGIVLGDSAHGTDLFQDFSNAVTKAVNLDCPMPVIKKPIEDVSKEAIYLTLKGYDDALGTQFLKHITSCEHDGRVCNLKKGRLCEPCAARRRVFENLGWIGANTNITKGG